MPKRSSMIQHLPWMIPLVFTMLGMGFELYSLIGRVDTIENRQRDTGEVAVTKLTNIIFRVEKLEGIVEDGNIDRRILDLEYKVNDTAKWCCDEIKDK